MNGNSLLSPGVWLNIHIKQLTNKKHLGTNEGMDLETEREHGKIQDTWIKDDKKHTKKPSKNHYNKTKCN